MNCKELCERLDVLISQERNPTIVTELKELFGNLVFQKYFTKGEDIKINLAEIALVTQENPDLRRKAQWIFVIATNEPKEPSAPKKMQRYLLELANSRKVSLPKSPAEMTLKEATEWIRKLRKMPKPEEPACTLTKEQLEMIEKRLWG